MNERKYDKKSLGGIPSFADVENLIEFLLNQSIAGGSIPESVNHVLGILC